MQILYDLGLKHKKEMDHAVLGFYFMDQGFHTDHNLSLEQVATLAGLLLAINRIGCAGTRFSVHDYVNALVYTKYEVNMAKLIMLGQTNFKFFVEVIVRLAEQKRTVCERDDYDDSRLVACITAFGL